jgi:hypothetical protein
MKLAPGAALVVSVYQLWVVLLPVVAGPPVIEQAAGEVAAPGEPGPSAVGIPVSPSQLPAAATSDSSEAVQNLPRVYPVDQATFERLKARAAAAAAGLSLEEAP